MAESLSLLCRRGDRGQGRSQASRLVGGGSPRRPAASLHAGPQPCCCPGLGDRAAIMPPPTPARPRRRLYSGMTPSLSCVLVFSGVFEDSHFRLRVAPAVTSTSCRSTPDLGAGVSAPPAHPLPQASLPVMWPPTHRGARLSPPFWSSSQMAPSSARGPGLCGLAGTSGASERDALWAP